MNADKLQDQLRSLLEVLLFACDDADADDPASEMAEYIEGIRSIATYDDVGILSMNKGLLIECSDGSEFQLTIVQSGLAREEMMNADDGKDRIDVCFGCPTCGQTDIDELEWVDDEVVRCSTCGTGYRPGEGPVSQGEGPASDLWQAMLENARKKTKARWGNDPRQG